jgi:hypothetical protein
LDIDQGAERAYKKNKLDNQLSMKWKSEKIAFGFSSVLSATVFIWRKFQNDISFEEEAGRAHRQFFSLELLHRLFVDVLG